MRLLVDENLSPLVADALRSWGFEVFEIRQLGLRGADDVTVFETAQSLGAALVTADKGFGDVRRFATGIHYGIIIIRVVGSPERQINALRQAILTDLKGQDIKGVLVVVTERKTRIRR